MDSKEPCCNFDLERMKKALSGGSYKLPDGPLTREQIRYYMLHPEECEYVPPREEDV